MEARKSQKVVRFILTGKIFECFLFQKLLSEGSLQTHDTLFLLFLVFQQNKWNTRLNISIITKKFVVVTDFKFSVLSGQIRKMRTLEKLYASFLLRAAVSSDFFFGKAT